MKERVLTLTKTVHANPRAAWQAWASAEDILAVCSVQAKVELRPGGAYEWYFLPSAPEGSRGAEGCTILSYLPGEMISFTWNAPPTIPALREKGPLTHVVITFDAVDGGTQLTLHHVMREGSEDWKAYHAYFERAWASVLGLHADYHSKSSEARKGSEAQDPAPEDGRDSWQDGEVTVTSVDGPERYQRFELVLPVPRKKAWETLASTEGLAGTFHPEARVELEVGGAYCEFPGSENSVLSYLPERMLSGTGGAPPEFPEVKRGGTWWVYRFDDGAEGETRLTMTLLGWREGDEWDRAYEYFLKNNAIFLNYLAKKLKQ